jgi:riboflavin synthase
MFTGIITQLGRMAGLRRGKQELEIEAPGLEGKTGPGDSVAVDGVCLTVVRRRDAVFWFDVSRETLSRTTLAGLKPRAVLNLELPVAPTGLLGGHLVSGHVDCRGRVLRVVERRPGKRMAITIPRDYRKYVIAKGSVAVNGVSLTVADVGTTSFEVELIPATLSGTNLGGLRAGDPVNIECDMIGKYVYNALLTEKR